MLTYSLPTLVLGGGGYTIRNVARCWTYETAVVLGEEPSNDLPYNDYYGYYQPDFSLHFPVSSTMENLNTRQYTDGVRQQVLENLRMLSAAPSVQMAQLPDNGDPLGDEAPSSGLVSKAEHPAEHYDGPGDNYR